MRRTLALALLVLAAPASAAPGSQPLELWTRAPGRYDLSPPPARQHVVAFALDRLPLVEGTLADVQYGGARHAYRYVPVEELVRRYGPPPEADTALLHFANGMIIPLAFRDRALMDELRPAIACAIFINDQWTTELPALSRHELGFPEARPIRFAGNKLVVAVPSHPALLPGTASSFSPWRHADSLVGIEFVVGEAYRAQFDVAPAAHAGLAVFEHVCSFCHGARDVGAQFGWDFVDPIPVVEYRRREVSLYYHVHYRATDAPSRGLMMPPLPFLNEGDAANVYAWLRALAARPLNAYAPR